MIATQLKFQTQADSATVLDQQEIEKLNGIPSIFTHWWIRLDGLPKVSKNFGFPSVKLDSGSDSCSHHVTGIPVCQLHQGSLESVSNLISAGRQWIVFFLTL